MLRERGKEEEKKMLSEGVSKSKGGAFLCFTKDVIDPHVVYIL